jgi:hypothetical protein
MISALAVQFDDELRPTWWWYFKAIYLVMHPCVIADRLLRNGLQTKAFFQPEVMFC